MKVKAKKKKIASLLPRRQWQINPLTKVKDSAKRYSRKGAGTALKKILTDE